MSRYGLREKELDAEAERCCSECAADGGGSGNRNAFRRSASLRLRGERPLYPQRPRLGGYPSITEHPRGDGARSEARPHRQRSLSLNNSSGAKVQSHKPISKTSPNTYMDPNASVMDTNTPPGSPEELPDDDSIHSYSSATTANSCDAGYAPYNGTTFSGRSMRYVLHCSSHAGLSGDEYLTPTQRAQKQIRRLKSMLSLARKDLEKKDSEIFQLTKEVVELRLYKASLCSPDDKSNSSEIVTVRENPEENEASTSKEGCSCDVIDGTNYQETPTRSQHSDMQSSFTDSGHFEDLTNSSLHSKDSIQIGAHNVSCTTEVGDHDVERRKLIEYYEKKIEDMVRSHIGETQEMKKNHNDKVESLLQKLADMNTRYCSLLPDYEQAKERLHVLERQLEQVSRQLSEEEGRHHAMYLQMFNKGLEAAKFDTEKEVVSDSPVKRVSVSQLLEQLQITQTELENVRDTGCSLERPSTSSQILLSAKEAVSLWVLGARKAMYRRIVEAQGGSRNSVDPEVTLQFLKSAIYYFLTDPENHQGHLNAIESILGFSDAEKSNIRKARSA